MLLLLRRTSQKIHPESRSTAIGACSGIASYTDTDLDNDLDMEGMLLVFNPLLQVEFFATFRTGGYPGQIAIEILFFP